MIYDVYTNIRVYTAGDCITIIIIVILQRPNSVSHVSYRPIASASNSYIIYVSCTHTEGVGSDQIEK